ncbi:type II toxin-antitoxin system death-on-curing family toxin [Pseudomonas sp. MH10]|uniref:type II toxin-antitoxin system death-on-curing family toxin n=1 Tax=Pseudomonas sp. MH10 TaxID=3048627 RepID=UPI002AC92311|nr:type II toxin-antitoxin system death-on-curing family toxin [Pseudomonas sp. MH10]MEB0039501.1 type II toxin-antitoxin system death-on-curing family toxin [Pseudomonas sp. MH10]WPX62435.1 type II toxin-antitoxin system death-on-curing family toxin [Pseudomonas sp. MH10]
MFLYFDTNHAIQIHDWIIENSGGRPGVFNIGNLQSPLEHVKNDDYYPTIEDKLNFLVYSINKNHAFNDGNKRSSIALGAYFLKLNGYHYAVSGFVSNMENIAVWVADNIIDRALLSELITSMIYEDEFSEALKIKLLTSISCM